MEELDRIYEAAVADDWEEQNRQEKDNFPKWDVAVGGLKIAKATIAAAAAILYEARDRVEGSTQEDRIASLAEECDTLAEEVAKQIERMR